MKLPSSLLLDMNLSSKDRMLCCQRDVCLRLLWRPQSSLCWESSKIVSFETRDSAKGGLMEECMGHPPLRFLS